MLIGKLNNKGIGLVEAVMAIAFAVVLVVALLSLTTFNVQNSFNVTQIQDATKNSSNLLEELRVEKDRGFEAFASRYIQNCSSSCFKDSDRVVVGCQAVRGSTCFKVTTDPDPDPLADPTVVKPISELRIEVISYYEQNKLLFSTATETIFSNWRTRE